MTGEPEMGLGSEELSDAERKTLLALANPARHTYIGGFNLGVVFELERRGLLTARRDPIFPSFFAYSITDAGKAAIGISERLK